MVGTNWASEGVFQNPKFVTGVELGGLKSAAVVVWKLIPFRPKLAPKMKLFKFQNFVNRQQIG